MPSVTSHAPRLYAVHNSPIHGKGVFATNSIAKGTRILEYAGERLSHEAANARYAEAKPTDIVLLFIVDDETVVDAAVGGSDARFINHSCTPNCESVVTGGKIFIEALRRISPGEELTYDYNLDLSEEDQSQASLLYPCACGSQKCRGTMAGPGAVPQQKHRTQATKSRTW
ncbi:MAG: SET domain-containing protein [Candidatus Binatia bacterium]